MVIEMETNGSIGVTSVARSFRSDEEHFYNCKSCGQPMMTTNYQAYLIAACPEWGATSVDEVRNILISSGVHYLFEVNKGYCEYCSRHFDGE